MKRLILSIALLAGVFYAGFAQNEDAIKFAGTINKSDLHDHISILASDALEGRETGKRGQKMAAAYIRAHFEELGLAAPVPTKGGNSYYQQFELESNSPGETYLIVNGEKKMNGEKVLYWGSSNMANEKTLEAIFAGNGSDLENMSIEGKAVIIYVKGSYQAIRDMKKSASNKGAALVLLVTTDDQKKYDKLITDWKGFFMQSSMGFVQKDEKNSAQSGAFFISPEYAASLLETKVEKLDKVISDQDKGQKTAYSTIKVKNITYKTARNIEYIKTENVLGYLEGSDRKDELVVITAHYDHEGRVGDVIYNGADDDASGTSSVLEIAEAFVKAKEEGKGPRRSILFMTVTGEEKGLLGSEYYADNPVFPLENTVVDLNIDMVGRIDPAHEENPNYLYLVGADKLSSELHEISEKVNETFTQFDLDYTYNEESHPSRIYYRSDHWNFAKNNVPVIFYYNGGHADYHKPTDTIEKIEFDLLTKRAQLVFHTAWVLANTENRIVVDKVQETKLGSK